MLKIARWSGQALFYAAAALLTGTFASWPSWSRLPEGAAQITVAFIHAGARKEACRKLSAEEIAQLPPRARRPSDCGRERVPLRFALVLDGRPIVARTLPPGGVLGDGPSRFYEKLTVAAGRHQLALQMADSGRLEGFDYEQYFEVDLRPGQNLAIDFQPDRGGFVMR